MLKTVDQTKCVGCGTCQKVCALDLFRLDLDQLQISPCTAACPIHNDMRRIHYLLQMGEIEKASALLSTSNPLASITGRICPHPCESECARNEVDSAVNISAIEQYLGDYVLDSTAVPVPRQHIGAVAIIGSGPAGLSCAYFLAAKGFSVTVYEARTEAGGMLRYGIPVYRLPHKVLNRSISRLEDMGVIIKCNYPVDRLDKLQDEGFSAVFIAAGAGKSRKLNIAGFDGNDIYYGLEFLHAVRTGVIRSMPTTVLIVGGGNVAIDAAQSARRLGAEKVTVLTLEEENCLPAHRHNFNSALAEGIEFACSWGVESLTRKRDGDSLILHAIRCVSVFDGTNAFAPQYDHTVRKDFSAHAVILAVGQESDVPFIPDRLLGPGRLIQVMSGTQQTASPLVFAAGDAVDGPASIAQAVGGAKRAARAIEQLLGGFEITDLAEENIESVKDIASPKLIKRMWRHEKQMMKKSDDDFAELSMGFDLVETLAEAERCMTCGAKAIAAHMDDCMTCFACELNCPAEAIFVHPFKEILPRAFDPEKVRAAIEGPDQSESMEMPGDGIGGHNE